MFRYNGYNLSGDGLLSFLYNLSLGLFGCDLKDFYSGTLVIGLTLTLYGALFGLFGLFIRSYGLLFPIGGLVREGMGLYIYHCGICDAVGFGTFYGFGLAY